MEYKFYDYKALQKEKIDSLKKGCFAISDSTYKNVIDSDNTNLMFLLFENRNKYDVCYAESLRDSNIPTEIALALQYEKMCHPDELMFITGDKELAKIANHFFGNDSIKVLS